MKKKIAKIVLICILTLAANRAFAQAGGITSGGAGGELSNFDVFGVGARPLAMGSAYVAAEADPLMIYWNPAGLDYLQRIKTTLFYTNLLESQFGFVGFAYPTLHFGTFAAGLMYLGTGDIFHTEDNPMVIDKFSFSDVLGLFSYAKQTPWWLSVGASIRILRQSNYRTDTAIGADIGFTFKPQLSHIALQNFTAGLSIQNLIPARPKLEDYIDEVPSITRFGISKMLPLGALGQQVTINLDIDKATNHQFRLHAGLEYIYQEYAMLRLGMNKDRLAFGAGILYQNFRLDYSFSQHPADWVTGSQHRVSFTYEFGKSRDQKQKDEDERRIKDIEAEIQFKNELTRKENISDGLAAGKQFLTTGELNRAYREFYKIIDLYGSDKHDPDVEEAKSLFENVEKKINAQYEKELAERAAENAAELLRLQQQQQITEYFEKGKSFFETDDFVEAIEEWNKALELDSLNQQVKEFRDNAIAMLKENINRLLNKANALVKTQYVLDALNVYTEIQRLCRPLGEEYRTAVDGRIAQLQRKLKSDDIVSLAARHEAAGEYTKAMELYYEALQYEPGNQALKKRYDHNRVRAHAKSMEMTPEVNVLYNEGYRFYLAKEFNKALEKFEKALELQPFNKELLDAVDLTKREIEKRSTSKLGQN